MTDPLQAYILNQTAVDAIGWDEPLGKAFNQWQEKNGAVIGVVPDFHFQSLHLKIEPLVITLTRQDRDRSYFSAKIKTEDVTGTIAFIENKFKEFSPGYPFAWAFLDDRLNSTYRVEQKLGKIFMYFTCIAIVIACLGLFGLGAFTTEKRTKEIGIRRILGASTPRIIFLLSKEFLKWVIFAAVIALPAASYAMSRWLENFAYRIRISPEVIILAFIASILISFVAVGYKSYRAASANPATTLRNE